MLSVVLIQRMSEKGQICYKKNLTAINLKEASYEIWLPNSNPGGEDVSILRNAKSIPVWYLILQKHDLEWMQI